MSLSTSDLASMILAPHLIVLHPRAIRRKQNADRKYVKWLGVIFDDSLEFDIHWKSRLTKARKALGAVSRVGTSQLGMCSGGWKKHTKG